VKRILPIIAVIAMLVLPTGCAEADVASQNLSTSADNFQISRRIVFYNGITNDYVLVIEGLCSLGNHDAAGTELSVTCKTGANAYKKHFLGLSDNVTYFAEQIEPSILDAFHYKVIFRPETIVPDVDVIVQ
jgi:hypothetical protein